MKTENEIENFADEFDKDCLLWLFKHYHMASQWRFVATCTHVRYGEHIYQTNRVWLPTKEGRALYSYYLEHGSL